jgi:Carboxypeptidase regulatory-like domain/TonB dependent receptor
MKRLSLGKKLLVFLAVDLFLAALCTYGQVVSGTIVGTITDTSGAVIPQAKVTVTDVDTGVSRILTTDSSGNYSVPQLPPGPYKVTVEKRGFARGIHTGVTLFAASTARVNITLNPGSVTQTVTVNGAAAPLLQTDTAQTGRTITVAEVSQLPLTQGHNFQNLLNLDPGTAVAERNHSTFYNPQNSMSSPTNGTPSRANTFNIEGINDNERSGLLQTYILPMESIQEVAVTSSNYDPAQGTALGSVVNVIIKSGTNGFHGEGYEFYTANALEARSFFEVGTNGAPFKFPHSVDNYYGANLGGPIQRDKTFFFVDYLRHPQRLGNFYTFTVPTAAMRQGDFSDPALPTIYNPASGDLADCLQGGNASLCGTGRTPFPGNLIPASEPVAERLLSHVLLPNANQNAPGLQKYENNLLISSAFIKNLSDLDAKIDRYQGQHDHISGRFSYTNPSLDQAGIFGVYGGPLAIGGTNGVEGTGSQSTYSTGINWVHTFSPTLLEEARIGLSRLRNTALPVGYGQDLSTQAGIPGANISPFTSGLTAMEIEGFSNPLLGVFSSFPWVRAQTNIVLGNKWTKIHGNHTLDFGFEYYRIRDDLLLVGWPMGEMSFNSGTTSLNGGTAGNFANAFASFLLDTPSSIQRGFANTFPAYRQNQIFPYVGDTWQVSKKLTFNLGLRWEYYGPPTPHFAGGFSDYNPTTDNLQLAGLGSIPRNQGLAADYHNFGPRVGVAYRVAPNSVMRAGFGMTTMAFPIDNFDYNYPIEPTQAFSSLSSYGPALLTGTTPATFERGFPALPPYVAPSNGLIPANTPLLQNQSYYMVPLNWQNPYIMSWNFAYERYLPGKWVLDVAYVGNRGVHAPVIFNLNAATTYGSGAAGQPEYKTFGRTAETAEYFAGFRSQYDALQVKFDHKFAHDFSVTTSYTYGKAMGYVSESGDYPNELLDYVNLRRNWAQADFNQTHILNQSFIWNLPFGKGEHFLNTGVTSRILGGWQFAGDWEFTSGFPLDFSGCDCPAFNTPGSAGFPNIKGPIRKLYGIQTNPWFDTSVISEPAAGMQGNVGAYVSAGPNFFNLDASLFRRIKLTERFNLELRSEWFSATNTPQFSNPDTSLGDPSFGLVTSATGARSIDFAAKLIF